MSAQSPAAGAKEQVARLLTLVPYLHSRGSVQVVEASEALGVTPEQLLKDLKILFMCGLPGGYPDDLIDVDIDALEEADGRVRGDGVIRVSNADYLTRPMRLTPTEASAMIVALRALRAGSGPDTEPIVDRVLAKLETAAATGPTEVHLDAAPGDLADAGMVALEARLADAVSRRVQVELDYYVPARDEMSRRVVDPQGLTTHEGFTYLDAWCHSAESPRLFRLDRVAAARVLEVPIVTEPVGARDLTDGMFRRPEDTTRVTLRLAAQARWVTEYYPVEDVRATTDGSGEVDVDLLVADERWLTRLLLRLSPHATVLAPASFGTAFRAAAQETLDLYS